MPEIKYLANTAICSKLSLKCNYFTGTIVTDITVRLNFQNTIRKIPNEISKAYIHRLRVHSKLLTPECTLETQPKNPMLIT